MEIRTATQASIDRFFKEDPQLAYLGLSDEELSGMFQDETYKMNNYSTYLSVQKDDKMVGLLKYEWFTTHCINFHMYIATNMRDKRSLLPISQAIKNYCVNEIDAMKAILMVPSTCEHIHNFVERWGFKKEGVITDCYQWRQETVDLIIYGINISRKT